MQRDLFVYRLHLSLPKTSMKMLQWNLLDVFFGGVKGKAGQIDLGGMNRFCQQRPSQVIFLSLSLSLFPSELFTFLKIHFSTFSRFPPTVNSDGTYFGDGLAPNASRANLQQYITAATLLNGVPNFHTDGSGDGPNDRRWMWKMWKKGYHASQIYE